MANAEEEEEYGFLEEKKHIKYVLQTSLELALVNVSQIWIINQQIKFIFNWQKHPEEKGYVSSDHWF